MGKGDRKSKKGKIWRGSYGVLRNKKSIKARLRRLPTKPAAPAPEEKPKPKRASRKKEASAE